DDSTPATQALDTAEGVIFNIAEVRITHDFVALKDILKTTWDQIEQIHKDQSVISGVPSGFNDLDAKTGGFQKSDLIIIAARPGVGKTSLTLNVAQHASIQYKIPVAIFSLEMSEQQLVTRLLCSEASVDSYRLRTGLLKDAEWPRIAQAMGALEQDSDLLLFIYRERFYNDNVAEDKRNIAEIIIAKHRNGPTGKLELMFIDEQTKFANLDRRRGS